MSGFKLYQIPPRPPIYYSTTTLVSCLDISDYVCFSSFMALLISLPPSSSLKLLHEHLHGNGNNHKEQQQLGPFL